MSEKSYTLPKDCDFSLVRNNSGQANDCSPKLDDAFFSEYRGIVISAPNQVVWQRGLHLEDFLISPKGNREGPLKIMLAGLLKLPYGTLGVNDDFKYRILVVAVDQDTAKVYQGRMAHFGSRAPTLSIPGYDEAKKGLDSQEYFNIDLVHNLALPIKQARYTVYASFGEYKSNSLEIDVKVTDSP